MAYKDPDKQREANRERQRRYKARSKALAKGVTSEGVTKGVTVTGEEVVIKAKGMTQGMTDVEIMQGMTEPKQGSTDERSNEPSNVIPNSDIHSVIPNRKHGKGRYYKKSKRGKDIKVFDDLPVDIRLIINRLSDSKEEKQRRTAVAINYQHQFSP